MTTLTAPQQKLIRNVQDFEKDPYGCSNRLTELRHIHGYKFVEAAACGLVAMALDNRNLEQLKCAARVAVKSWKFHVTAIDDSWVVCVDGDPIGTYDDKGMHFELNVLTIRGDETTAPIDRYVATGIQQKIWSKGGKHYVIEVAKNISSLQHFYPEDRICRVKLTDFKLLRYEAYVIKSGPWDYLQDALAHRLETYK
jgi:hypothetical protein